MLSQSAVNLYGPDLNFICSTKWCEGNDAPTRQIFSALQAQINRFAVAGSKSSSNPDLWKKLIIFVTGLIDKNTVNTYKLIAGGLAQMGASPPVSESQASMQTLAERADEIARFMQDAADRAGLPAGVISMSTGGGFGPTTSTTGIDQDAIKRITAAAATVESPSPLVSFFKKLPGATSPGGKVAWAVGGGALLLGLGYLIFRTPDYE